MKTDQLNIVDQWQTAVRVTESCRNQAAQLNALDQQIDQQHKEHREALAKARQQAEFQRDQQRDAVQRATEQQKLQIQQDVNSHLKQIQEQHRRNVHNLTTQTNQQLSELEDRRQQEDWILNSVLDENTDDSPVVAYDRATEAFVLQHESFQESSAAAKQSLQKAADYLSECHARMEQTLPAPNYPKGKLEEIQELAASEFSNIDVQLKSLYEYRLPSMVRGLRLAGLSLLALVLVWIPVIAARADLMHFVNPELHQPDWEWVGVAGVISAIAVGTVALTILLKTQSRLRNRFAESLQSFSNGRAAAAEWEQRTGKKIDRLESVAAKYEEAIRKQRLEKQQTLQQTIDQQVHDVRTHADQMTNGMTQQLNAATAAAEQHLSTTIAGLDQTLKQQLDEIETQHQSSLTQQHAHLEQRHQECVAERLNERQSIVQSWDREVEQFRRYMNDGTESVRKSLPSPSPDSEWQLPATVSSFVALGDLLVTVPARDEQATDGLRNLCLEAPAVLPFPSRMSLCVRHDAAGRDIAISFLRRQLLTAITNLPPGRFRLTLIDPVGLGQSFSALMHLADYDELLIHSRIWTESRQIREQLQRVTEHMENIFQTYLRSEFESIDDYNKSAGEVAEPYHFVVVAGFPNAFTEDSAMALSSILTSGPQCGVHAMIAWNPASETPPSFDNDELLHHCTNFVVEEKDVRLLANEPRDQQHQAIVFEARPEPPTADYVKLIRRIGDLSRNARRVEVSFGRVAPATDRIWSHSTADGIDLAIGRAGAARLQYMRLGRGTSQHVLVAGKTGSGKSTFLHVVITNLALHYSPSELQFFLIDFKKGVEFRTYAANRLPHAQVVAIESDREFGLSVLEHLDRILQERGELFRERGVQDVPSFRSQFPDEPMPRLLLLIDEFQEFFVAEDRVSSRASLLLDRLVRQGRAFGVHVLLGSQTLGGAYSLARSTMGQIAVRIALQCSENDAHLILSEDNSAARLLTRPGEAIYNDANGLVQGNNTFQIAWLEDDRRQQAIDEMNQRVEPENSDATKMIVFEGNVAPSAEQCAPLNAWLTTPPDATSRHFDGLNIWLGEPLAIAPPTQIQLKRAGGQNVVIVGQSEKMANCLLAFTMLSLTWRPSGQHTVTQTASESPRNRMFLLLDRTDQEAGRQLMQLVKSSPNEAVKIGTPADVNDILKELIQQIEQREASAESAQQPTWILAVRNLGQFRELRKAEDDFGLGGFGESKPETAASQFAEVIKRGPNVGIHVVLWCDTFSNAVRWLSNALLREFETRIAFRVNQTDSSSLVDSPVAANLENGRAIIYRDETGGTEKFRPFEWPSNEWLCSLSEEAERPKDQLESPDSLSIPPADSPEDPLTDGPDIDALTIE